jgi:hypothetical protein
MSTSAARAAAFAVTTPSGTIRSIGSVTSSTFGRVRAGYQSLENTTRSQPIT